MSKIPFSIKFRPQIESGEYKVFAYEHEKQEARIVCWDNKGEYPIIALVDNEPEKFDKYGRVPRGNRGGEFSLFIVTPEEELSEFEIRLLDWLSDDTSGEIPMERMKEVVRNRAAELRSLVKEEFENEAPSIIETQSFREGFKVGEAKAMKDLPSWNDSRWIYEDGWLQDGFLYYRNHSIPLKDLEKLPGFKGRIAMSKHKCSGCPHWKWHQKDSLYEIPGYHQCDEPDYCDRFRKKKIQRDNVGFIASQCLADMKEALRTEYEKGRADALKDLPRWEKYPHNAGGEPLVNGILQKDGSYKWRLYLDGYKIEISDLEKLPGFKED